MTAFVPIPAREAAEMVEAAGIPDGRRLLIDSAAASLVKSYALATETVDANGLRSVVFDAAIPVELWHRMVKAGGTDDIWCGGTVRLAGNGLIGGVPDVHVTGVGFGEGPLHRLIARHAPRSAVRPATISEAPPAPPAVVPAQAASSPSPPPTPRKPNPSAIPPGAITVTVRQAMVITGLGRTTIDKLMGNATLQRVKIGGRTLITVESIRRMLRTGGGALHQSAPDATNLAS